MKVAGRECFDFINQYHGNLAKTRATFTSASINDHEFALNHSVYFVRANAENSYWFKVHGLYILRFNIPRLPTLLQSKWYASFAAWSLIRMRNCDFVWPTFGFVCLITPQHANSNSIYCCHNTYMFYRNGFSIKINRIGMHTIQVDT